MLPIEIRGIIYNYITDWEVIKGFLEDEHEETKYALSCITEIHESWEDLHPYVHLDKFPRLKNLGILSNCVFSGVDTTLSPYIEDITIHVHDKKDYHQILKLM